MLMRISKSWALRLETPAAYRERSCVYPQLTSCRQQSGYVSSREKFITPAQKCSVASQGPTEYAAFTAGI